MCPQLPTPGYELPLKFAFQRALLTPQSSLWDPSLAAQGDSGFKNGIVHGVPFLGKHSCFVDVISAIFLLYSKISKQPDGPTPSSISGRTLGKLESVCMEGFSLHV